MGLIHLVLASQSPRRRELLAESGRSFAVIPAENVDEESPQYSADPAALAVRNALKKARAAADLLAGNPDLINSLPADSIPVIIGCDTVACVPASAQGTGIAEILGKPKDRADAERMLRTLSGSDHAVVSGLVLILFPSRKEITASETTTLTMDQLSDQTIEEYLESGAWQGKAGAFGYQDGIGWLHKKSGSESNIVGLPMELLGRMLENIEEQKRFPQ